LAGFTPQPARERGLIRVLIADVLPDARDNVEVLLKGEEGIEVIGVASDGQTAISLARESKPDIVLLDAELPGIKGVRTAELLSEQVPTAAIILMAGQPDMATIRHAMQAGARDFLAKPLRRDDLVASVRNVFGLDRAQRAGQPATTSEPAVAKRDKGKIICVFSPKGGVGRTTVAVNLAIALRTLTGKRVALADCNLPFGDVGIAMNLVAKKTMADLLPSISDLSPETMNSVLAVHESGVRVLLAPTRPELAELFQPDHLKHIMEALRSEHDYVVVDTWTSFHEVILAVFDLSSEIVLLTTLDMPAVKNIRMFLEVCEALKYPKDHVLLVLNRADSTGGLRVEDIEESIQHKVAANIVSAGPLVTSAINRGVPFLTSDPEAAISRDILNVARLVLHPEDRNLPEETGAAAPEENGAKPVPARRPGLRRLVPSFQAKR
jgi:pilus assembly protein CpaE